MAREGKRRRWQDRGEGDDKRQDQAMQGLARQNLGRQEGEGDREEVERGENDFDIGRRIWLEVYLYCLRMGSKEGKTTGRRRK